jgi:hypothetical protein
VDKGPGRVETRRIWTSATRNGSVAFPYVAPGACVERDIGHVRRATTPLERVSLLSSLSRTEARSARSWRSTGDMGESRTAGTMSVTWPLTRIAVVRARARRLVCWPVSAMSRSACCASSRAPTSRPHDGTWRRRRTRSSGCSAGSPRSPAQREHVDGLVTPRRGRPWPVPRRSRPRSYGSRPLRPIQHRYRVAGIYCRRSDSRAR